MYNKQIIKQVNVDCYGCCGDLNNAELLIKIIEDAALKTGARVIGKSVQSYPLHGLTAVVFLAESHILVSTYPEIKYAVLEVFMCGETLSPEECAKIIIDFLKPREVVNSHIVHMISKNAPQESTSE